MVLLQISIVDTSAGVADGVSVGELSMSFWELALKGGWVMVPLLLLSIIAVYIFMERYFAIKSAAREDSGFMEKIKQNIQAGKIDMALSLCQTNFTPIARMLEKGIKQIGRSLEDISTSIENVGKLEIHKLEKGLAALATIASAAPMLGFLGTVLGMIRAFYDMANAGHNIDVSLLSTGIYTALVTTATGLIIGIIAHFAYNILVSNIEKVIYKLELRTTEFMDLLKEPAK